jgi:RNA polymerase sigma-70 factor, ECF subfamily
VLPNSCENELNFFAAARDEGDEHRREAMDDERIENLAGLYKAHGPDLLRYLRRRRCAGTGGPSAEDLLQETFVQALRRSDALAGARSPRAWLFGIARHVALTAARRARPMQPLDALAISAGRESAADEDPRLDAIRSAISGLPDILREALELRLREGLSYEETADVLGIPVGTVRSRLHHAVRRLREAVGPSGDETNPARPAVRASEGERS